MANKYGTNSGKSVASPLERQDMGQAGRVRWWYDTVEVAVADVLATNYVLHPGLPREARILPISTIYSDALGATFSAATFGDLDTYGADVLATIDLTNAGSKGVLEDIAIEDYGKMLWELLGFAAAEDCPSHVVLKLAPDTDPDTAGTVALTLYYVLD